MTIRQQLDQAVTSFNNLMANSEEIIMAQMIAEREEMIKAYEKKNKKGDRK